MLLTEPGDNAFLEHELTASQLLARFQAFVGRICATLPALHERRPLASWGLPTHARWRKARRESASGRPAAVPAVRTPKLAIGVTTAWSASAPPAQSGA
jgi:hypothetical protein